MSVIISKPKDISLEKNDLVNEGVIPECSYYVGIIYPNQDQKIQIDKFKTPHGGGNKKAWEKISTLSDVPALIFFHPKKEKIFERSTNNLPPVFIHDKLGYIGAGKMLDLCSPDKKVYSDIFRFKTLGFEEMEKAIPRFFFSYPSNWILESVIPSTAALAFINGEGLISITNKSKGQEFKGIWYFDSIKARKK